MPEQNAATAAQLRINRLQELPPLSLVSQQLLDALGNERASMEDVSRVVELDPALAARIVGVARSAFFGNTHTIYNVKDAIIRVLGLDMVRSLALSISFGDGLRYDQVRGFDACRYWTTALLVADMARYLAPRATAGEGVAAEPAYLAGLLHSLGLLALAHLFPAELTGALDEGEAVPVWRLAPLERRWVGIDHHTAGAWLARRWHLPEEVVVAMERHHETDYRGPLWPTALLVGACVRWAEWRLDNDGDAPGEVTASLAELGIATRDMPRIGQVFGRKYDQTREMAAALARGG